MKILGIIPARYASTRFPGKPLVNIQGKTMVMRVYEQCKKCVDLTEVIVATDDIRIFDHVNQQGGLAIMTGLHHENGTSRCAEVVNTYRGFDAVINIQGDEPFINPAQISELASLLKSGIDIATLAHEMEENEQVENPNYVKVVMDHASNALYFSRSAIPFSRDLHEKNIAFFKHIGIYGFKPDVLVRLPHLEESYLDKKENLEQLRWLYWGYKIKVGISKYSSPSIDTPSDLDRILKSLG